MVQIGHTPSHSIYVRLKRLEYLHLRLVRKLTTSIIRRQGNSQGWRGCLTAQPTAKPPKPEACRIIEGLLQYLKSDYLNLYLLYLLTKYLLKYHIPNNLHIAMLQTKTRGMMPHHRPSNRSLLATSQCTITYENNNGLPSTLHNTNVQTNQFLPQNHIKTSRLS
jgi:hypothetical protein